MLQHCSDVFQLLSNVTERSIILFEDIDVAFGASDSDSRSMSHSRTKVTFSDLFNALDGVVAQTDSLVIMTTNHVEKLDPAMIRPGRIDVREHFSHVKASEAEQAYVLFIGHEKGARRFGEKAETKLWTMADVQKELLMMMPKGT